MTDLLFPEMAPSTEARGRLMKTLSQRGEGPYVSCKHLIDTPRYRAYWAGATAGQLGLPLPDFDTDEERQEAKEGFRFGRLGRPIVLLDRRKGATDAASQDATRTRDGRLLSEVIHRSSTGFPQDESPISTKRDPKTSDLCG